MEITMADRTYNVPDALFDISFVITSETSIDLAQMKKEITKAKNDCLKGCHPDKNGTASDEEKAKAEEKAKRCNAAFDYLKERWDIVRVYVESEVTKAKARMEEMKADEARKNTAYFQHGSQAVHFWRDAEATQGIGNAYALLALAEFAEQKGSLVASVKDDKGNNIEITFNLLDIVDDPKDKDGKVLRKVQTARIQAVMYEVFGLSVEGTNVFTQADVQKVRYTMPAVKLVCAYAKEKNKSIADVISIGEDKLLRVPNSLVTKKPDDKADANAKAQYEALKDAPMAITGKGGYSFAEMVNRAKEKGMGPKPRTDAGSQAGRTGSGQQVSEFTNAVNMVFNRINGYANQQQGYNLSIDEMEAVEKLDALLTGFFNDKGAYNRWKRDNEAAMKEREASQKDKAA
jgi:hypothetical protein